MGKLFLRSFGCQMNEYDSDRIAGLMREAEGLEKTESAAEADLIVFNTCSVREKAQEKGFPDLGRWRNLKKPNPNSIIPAAASAPSQEGPTTFRPRPYANWVS